MLGARYKSLQQEDFDLCGACFGAEGRDPSVWERVTSNITGSVASSFYGPGPGNAGAQVHHGIVCDFCNVSPIVGPRFRCLDREDFDLCQACMPRSAANPETAALRFEQVGAMVVAGAALSALEAAEQAHANDLKESQAAEQPDIDMDADGEQVDRLSESAMRDVLHNLLVHPSAAIRSRARDEVRAAVGSVQEPEQMQVEEPTHVQAEAPTRGGAEGSDAALAAASAAPSARVLACEDLILGVEAEEDLGSSGDLTAEFSQLLSQAGAKQAFRIARVVVPVGLPSPVPACTKVVLLNDGAVPWPVTTALVIVAGDALSFPQMALGPLQPGEAAEAQMDLQLPPKAGKETIRSTWALVDAASGWPLGPLIFFESVWA